MLSPPLHLSPMAVSILALSLQHISLKFSSYRPAIITIIIMWPDL